MSEMPSDDHGGAVAAQGATVRLRNARLGPVEYVLEPWGEVYELRPGATLRLVADGLNGEYLEIVFGEARVTTWSDTGSTVAHFEGDRELGPGLALRPRVPRYPPGFRRQPLPLPRSAAHRVELLLLNHGKHLLALLVPSQPEQYTLPRGARCAVVAEGMTAGPIELELREDAVLVYGWPASRIVVVEEEAH
jgi:hypothetical protein